MSILESSIEEAATEYARKNGLLVLKFTPMGQRGWPDRVFIAGDGTHFYIEFKRPGQKPRKLQEHRMQQLELQGCLVYWADNLQQAKDIINEFVLESS